MKRLNNFIVSDTKGRMRLRVPALKNLKTAERMLEELKTLEGVRKADVNQITGSVLLEYDPHTFERRGLAHVFNEVVPHAKPLPTLSHRTKKMLRSKEMRLFENKGMLVCGLTSCSSRIQRIQTPHCGRSGLCCPCRTSYLSLSKEYASVAPV